MEAYKPTNSIAWEELRSLVEAREIPPGVTVETIQKAKQLLGLHKPFAALIQEPRLVRRLETRRALYAAKRADGICHDCSDPVLDGHARCERHLESANHQNRIAWREKQWSEEDRVLYELEMAGDL